VTACSYCDEPITAAELADLKARDLNPTMHQECLFRAVCGSAAHQLRECTCFGGEREDPPGMSVRDAARLAFETYRMLH
jgi:hypothetical protein